jgi:anti-sigma factor RsiW
MKTCEYYEVAISCYVDGELQPSEQAEMFGHLMHCIACASYLETAVRIRIETAKETRYKFPDLIKAEARSKFQLPGLFDFRRILLGILGYRIQVPAPIAITSIALLVILAISLTNHLQPQEAAQQIQVVALPMVEVEGFSH